MDEQLVTQSIKILRLYYAHKDETWFGVNEIMRRTGCKDKPKIIDSIHYLVDGSILDTQKQPNQKQLKPMILTRLGKEIINLWKDIDECKSSYENVNKRIGKIDIKLGKKSELSTNY